jgi:hypothetical protein
VRVCNVGADPETGKVTKLRFAVVQDVGWAIPPRSRKRYR